MAAPRRAKLFQNGASQAVRLPAEFRFPGTEVYVSRDERTGDVILSSRPSAGRWSDFFALLRTIDEPSDFMAERALNRLPTERALFEDDA